MEKEIRLEIEELEERIAPSVTGLGGFEGQPGNQAGPGGNPGGGLQGYEGQPGHQAGN